MEGRRVEVGGRRVEGRRAEVGRPRVMDSKVITGKRRRERWRDKKERERL